MLVNQRVYGIENHDFGIFQTLKRDRVQQLTHTAHAEISERLKVDQHGYFSSSFCTNSIACICWRNRVAEQHVLICSYMFL